MKNINKSGDFYHRYSQYVNRILIDLTVNNSKFLRDKYEKHRKTFAKSVGPNFFERMEIDLNIK